MRGGFSPWSLDQFADEDLRATGPATQVGGQPQAWLDAFATAPHAPWLYTGGLENHPRAIGQLAKLRPLWGVAGRMLRAVRDPLRLADVLRQEGWPTLPVVHGTQIPEAGEWLRKPRRSGGGLGITLHLPATSHTSSRPAPSRRHYFQLRLPPGTPILGATYLMADGQARLLGVARQFHGLDGDDQDYAASAQRCLRFVYRGSITTSVNATDRASFEQLGQLLAVRFGLRGIIGVDAALHDGRCWVLEVNPRYPASAELFEDDDHLPYPHTALKSSAVARNDFRNGGTVRSFIQLHAEVWQGRTVDEALHAAGTDPNRLPLGLPNLVRGKWIVYARAPVVWPEERDFGAISPTPDRADEAVLPFFQARLADVPAKAAPIAAGHPICTLLAVQATDHSSESPEQRLKRLEKLLLRRLQERTAGGG